ncbi:alpha/beta hydrolase [Chondrinema litorale]|uniref:alpha/beta hydrolase n=1 Tax=Chondrinema litorale TaxID=2994555 RepID=UPI002543612C|nr:alpha/beta fold hydrolase [Chondrinema litorale]UZR92563.1 alpha/beta fold hydrolase [Chondrinema litorale]
MSFFKRYFFPTLLILLLISCTKTDNPFKGSWIGTAETKPFPELLYLYNDSSLLVKMFYSGIELHQASNYSIDGNQIKFEVNQPEFRGEFEGKLEQNIIKGKLKSGDNIFDCNFVNIQPEGPEIVSQFSGFYQLGAEHIIQFTPYALDFSLTPLSVTDFKTGKKRIAFPQGNNSYIAGERMLSPYPTDFAVSFEKGSGDTLKVQFTSDGKTIEGKRLADLDKIIEFSAQNDDISLKANLNLPASEGPFPLVVIVHGAGNQSRSNYTLEDFAALLPYYGIATLIYDKRGCGESEGDLQSADFETLGKDVEALIKAATEYTEIDKNKIGLMGIDQAGYLMPIIANENKDIQFIVGISTPILGMQEQELHACAMRMESDGFAESDINAALEYQKTMFAYLGGKIDSVQFQNASDEMAKEAWSDYVTSFDKKEWINWWRKNYHFSPLEPLSKINIPTFMSYGGQDQLTNPEENLAELSKILSGEEHQHKIYPKANHFMYIAGNRGDFQLTEIKGYPEGVFNEINEWIAEKFGLIGSE